MDHLKNCVKREIGIVFCMLFAIAFMLIAKTLMPHFYRASWYVASSVQRLLFGMVELWIFIKLFKKERWTEVIHFRNFKHGLTAGSVMFLVIFFEIVTYLIIGAKSWIDTTAPTVVSYLFFQQITTGFWEELTFRAFVMEGYYKTEHRTKKARFIYAFVSFSVFGMLHAVEYDRLPMALYRFMTTGIWGFAFASIYLYSHNILVVMFLHFFTNIFLNAKSLVAEWNDSTALIILDNYVYFLLLGALFLSAVIFLCRNPNE